MDIIRQATSSGCSVAIEMIMHKAGAYPLVRITDRHPSRNRGGIFLLTAGIHGTEVAGPLTIQNRFAEIIELTRKVGLQLVCYPLMNPSGYDNGTDRNIDGDGGDAGNNDFLRFLLENGVWTWQPPADQSVKIEKWCWSSEPEVGERQPAETALMHKFLRNEDWQNMKVALDIHQDNLTQGLPDGAYQYPFGDVSRYNGIINQVRTLTTVLGDYDFRFNRDNPNDVVRSDQNGCIVQHDGSLSDLAYHYKVPYALTIETVGATPLQTAIEVNMIWIRGLCELANH
jgi:hypothetical protein